MAKRRIKKKKPKLREGKIRISPITQTRQKLKDSRWQNIDTHRDVKESSKKLKKNAIIAGLVAGGAVLGAGAYLFAHSKKFRLPTKLLGSLPKKNIFLKNVNKSDDIYKYLKPVKTEAYKKAKQAAGEATSNYEIILKQFKEGGASRKAVKAAQATMKSKQKALKATETFDILEGASNVDTFGGKLRVLKDHLKFQIFKGKELSIETLDTMKTMTDGSVEYTVSQGKRLAPVKPKTIAEALFDAVGFKSKTGGDKYAIAKALESGLDKTYKLKPGESHFTASSRLVNFLHKSRADKGVLAIDDYINRISDLGTKVTRNSKSYKDFIKSQKKVSSLFGDKGDKVLATLDKAIMSGQLPKDYNKRADYLKTFLYSNYADTLYGAAKTSATEVKVGGLLASGLAGGFFAGSYAIPSWEHTRKEMTKRGKQVVMRGASYGLTRTEAAMIKKRLLGANEEHATVIL